MNITHQTYNRNQTSFNGKWIYNRDQDVFKSNFIQTGLEKLLKKDRFEKIGQWGNKKQEAAKKSNYDKLTKHFSVLVSTVLSSLYVFNTSKSKTIEKDRKPALITNMALVWGISTVSGYLLDNSINKKFDKFLNKVNIFNSKNIEFKAKNGNIVKTVPLKNIVNGLKIAKGLVIFSMMYRYFGPVIATPLADKVSKLLFPNKTGNKPAAK